MSLPTGHVLFCAAEVAAGCVGRLEGRFEVTLTAIFRREILL
ncbi:hypothetical protein [Roseinatronobacter sp.]|nr:hypothetical protein [Rhodobaca sp.]